MAETTSSESCTGVPSSGGDDLARLHAAVGRRLRDDLLDARALAVLGHRVAEPAQGDDGRDLLRLVHRLEVGLLQLGRLGGRRQDLVLGHDVDVAAEPAVEPPRWA